MLTGMKTPTKDGSTSGRDVNGSPEYKTCDQSVLVAQAAKEDQKDTNGDISDLAEGFIRAHKAIRLKVDSLLSDVMDLLDRAVQWFAQAIPAGPKMAEYLKCTLPLRPCEVSPSVIHELKGGKEPTYCEVHKELAGLSVHLRLVMQLLQTPEYPEATASRARNQHRRIKYPQTDSD